MAGEKFIALEETSQEIKASVSEVKTDTGNILNLASQDSGVIKHIQRGVGTGGTITVQLAGFTNIDKMIVIINGDCKENSRWTVCEYYLKSLTVSQAIITTLNNSSISQSSCSYQVIEFC